MKRPLFLWVMWCFILFNLLFPAGCSQLALCSSESDCERPLQCKEGKCVSQCIQDKDCDQGKQCQNAVCVSTNSVKSQLPFVSARYQGNTKPQIFKNDVSQVIDFPKKVFDTHSAVTAGKDWLFKAPIKGVYRASCKIFIAPQPWKVDGDVGLFVRVNAKGRYALLDHQAKPRNNTKTYLLLRGSALVSLNKGDTIDFVLFQHSGGDLKLDTYHENHYAEITLIGAL